MLKISDFSRLTFVPAKTLRYYDEIELFKPVHLDRFTGYRYYSVEQLPRLYRILAFKGLGLSLSQIKQLLDEDLSTEQIRGMLRLKQMEITQRLEEEQLRLTHVETMIQRMERTGMLSDYEVILKKVEPMQVAYIRGIAKTEADLGRTFGMLFETVFAYIRKHDKDFSAMGISIYHGEEWKPHDIQVEAAVPITDELPESGDVKIRMLAGSDAMASVVHRGHFSEMHHAYTAILEWISANGYSICGSPREIPLKFEHGGNPADFVTEIQFPVEKN